MSSNGQATLSTDNVQLIIGALADYAKETGIDLSKNPFAAKLQQSRSLDAILQLLEEREKAFNEYRNKKWRLVNCLNPVVKILHRFSGILYEPPGRPGMIPIPPTCALFVGIDTLLGAACETTSSYDALSDLFEHLGCFVKRLDIYTNIPLTPIMTDMIVKIMVELLSVLALATKQITQGRFKKFAKKLLREREIEVVLQRLDRLTQDEVRITVAQTLGVVHGLVGNVKEIMEDREASLDIIQNDLGALHRGLIETNKTRRDQLQRDVNDWLTPPDPSTNHNFVLEARHAETGAWLFKSETLREWNARGSLLWIHGKPGAGKSTLLSAVIEDVEIKRAIGLAKMAYYYFDFRDSKKQDCYGLLSSLILQLSLESDSCCNILSKFYSDNNLTRKPTLTALKKCMKDMLSQSGQGPIYIIVDALDECSNSSGTPSARGKVLELIKELVGWELPDVHLCVASRPEIDIQKVLYSLNALQISLHNETGQEADIIAYIKSLVNSNSVLDWTEEDENLVINTLSQKANGMFRWVACLIDNVLRCYSNDIQGVLDDLPEDLDETYERILRDIDNQKRKYAQRLFQCLLVSIRPLRVEELAAILSLQFDATAPTSYKKRSRPLDAKGLVLSTCSSLITIVNQGNSHVVQFAHFSVKEFLTSERLANAEERLSFYHILPEPAHTLLAHASLSVLLRLDDKIDRNIITHSPLTPYAAQHWVDHAQYRDVSSHLQEVVERLLDPEKPHFTAWVWLYDIDHYWIEPMSTTHPTMPEALPIYYASLCGFHDLVEHLISAHSSDVNSRGGSYMTPLHAASIKGHSEVALLLLKNGADPNAVDDTGKGPLHRISQGGQLVIAFEIARLLVDHGADINATDYVDSTPLHTAARYGCRDVAELLLESGANVNVQNEYQDTPLHLSCESGKLDTSHFLIDRGSDINSPNENGFVPLHMASRFGHIDVAQLLLDCGTDVNIRSANRWTPLHYASQLGYVDLARLLINRGADVNIHSAKRWTPLYHVPRSGYVDLARLSTNRAADVSAHNANGSTPMHLASGDGHLDIVKLLVDQGANVDSRNGKGETPLNWVSKQGSLEMARFLIKHGADVSSGDDEGWTPFHNASFSGHFQVMEFFLECGVDVDIRNANGETSLHLASRSRKLDVVRFLIDHGADIHVKNDQHWNPLHAASENGHLDVVQRLINTGLAVDIRNGTQETPLALASSNGKADVVSFLIERGASLNARDSQYQVPLHAASQHGHLDVAQLLLDQSVDPNIQRDDLSSPLHLASANGHMNVAELLVQYGASIDITDDRQETPLYQAVWNGKIDIARLLIDHGADLHSTDSDGWTPLHAASQRGHLEVVKLLLWWGADVDVVNKANKTAAELAPENGKGNMATFISEYKADASILDEVQSATSETAQSQYGVDEDGKEGAMVSLHAAAEEGNVEAVQLVLKRGADINSRNTYNKTPLDGAAAKGNIDVVCLLIERGAEVDPRDKWGWTPLHSASVFGHLEVSRILIDHGANVNARQVRHFTPLGISAIGGHLGIVKLLLEHGADITARNDRGETPYQLSLRSGSRETINFLRERSVGMTST